MPKKSPSTGLASRERSRLSQTVFSQLSHAIIGGEFEPGARISEPTLSDVSRLDAEFHDRIVRAAGNRRLLLCWNSLCDQFALWLTQMQLRHEAVTHRTRQETVESHDHLLDAIRSGDAKQAAEVARRLVAGCGSG
ncbi:MAG: FCD domain-containing protein [Planctomycetia bacterium]